MFCLVSLFLSPVHGSWKPKWVEDSQKSLDKEWCQARDATVKVAVHTGVGTAVGAGVGAIVGSVVPGAGTVAGAASGAKIGAGIGASAGTGRTVTGK